MILIDSMEYEGTIVKFYNGVDFDKLIKHPKDGKEGFIFCFIENWVKEVKSYNRELKLESIVNNSEFNEFKWDLLENNYISVYQTSGIGIDVVYETIRCKLEKSQFPDQPWVPISGISNGAWKISNNQTKYIS
jgi:hypothetical protein